MPLSIDELRRKVEEYHNKGLNSQQIADELSLSQTTIQWLSSSNVPLDEETPSDIRVGWRSVAVKALGMYKSRSSIPMKIVLIESS